MNDVMFKVSRIKQGIMRVLCDSPGWCMDANKLRRLAIRNAGFRVPFLHRHLFQYAVEALKGSGNIAVVYEPDFVRGPLPEQRLITIKTKYVAHLTPVGIGSRVHLREWNSEGTVTGTCCLTGTAYASLDDGNAVRFNLHGDGVSVINHLNARISLSEAAREMTHAVKAVDNIKYDF